MRLSEYTNMLKKFGLFPALKEIKYRFYSNILERIFYLKRDKDTTRYLKRYLKNTLQYADYYKPLQDLKPCIWTLWLQGLENAPPIVKACIESMRKFSEEYEVIVLTEETIKNYVTMPDFIFEKFKKGIIQTAQFSDFLRTLLLLNYGGIWIDATVFLTKPIPQNILSSDFFMFQSSLLHNQYSPCSSWFIVSQRNNKLLINVFEIMVNYWKNHKYLIHYFLFHITIGLIINNDDESKELWHKMFYKNNSDPHLLQKRLFDDFEPNMKDYIWDLSFIHKLTYKFNDKSLTERTNTFYQYIIKN